MPEPWYKSKTKRGGVLICVGTVIATVGMVDTGDIGLAEGISLIATEIGVLFTIFGLRNAMDKKK